MPRSAVIAATTTLAALAATFLVAPAVAQAAPAAPAAAKTALFQATAAGTAASLVGGTVSSSPSAPTAVKTRATTSRNAASLAGVTVPGVLTTGGVSTSSSTAPAPTGTGTVVSGQAHTANVNLLAGVVTVGAIDTTSALTVTSKKVTPTTTTTFTGLKISGNPVINGTVAPNTTIEVPDVARVVLNSSGSVSEATSGTAVSTAIIVTVLGGTFAGSVIAVNPTTAQTLRVGPAYAPLGGFALGAQVTATGDGGTSASVGPFGAIGMPDVGTGGKTLTDALAGADLGALGTVSGLTATANGSVANSASRSTMTARVAKLNLLGGLITANGLTATAKVTLVTGGVPVPTASATFTGLTVAGVPVPADAVPGLTIPLPGIGAVAIRATVTTANAAAAAALQITLTTAAFGYAAGTTIQVGFAYASLSTD